MAVDVEARAHEAEAMQAVDGAPQGTVIVGRKPPVRLLDIELHGGLGNVGLEPGDPARRDLGRGFRVLAHPLVGFGHRGQEFFDRRAIALDPGPQRDVEADIGDDIAAANHLVGAGHVLERDDRPGIPAREGIDAAREQGDRHVGRRRIDQRHVGRRQAGLFEQRQDVEMVDGAERGGDALALEAGKIGLVDA